MKVFIKPRIFQNITTLQYIPIYAQMKNIPHPWPAVYINLIRTTYASSVPTRRNVCGMQNILGACCNILNIKYNSNTYTSFSFIMAN